MPEESKNLNNQNDGESKRWKGIKQDPKSGQYIVYITESTDRAFDTIDEAVSYMTKASAKDSINVSAGSPEFSGVQRGQDNIDGVKQVTITRKLVETGDGDWKVKEKTRTDIIKNDEESAKSAYKNIDNAKEEAEYIENPFEEDNDEDNVEKESSVNPIGTCANCGASIYPPGLSSEDMAPWFDRHIPADLLCPACGYGIGEPTNFIYSNEKFNDESVDKFSSLDKNAEATNFSVPLRSLSIEIDKEFLKKIILDKGLPYNDSVTDIYYELDYGDLNWSFDTVLDSMGVDTFRIEIPDQTISVYINYEYNEDEDSVDEYIDIPLSNIDFTVSNLDIDNGSGLYPSNIEIFSDGSAMVDF